MIDDSAVTFSATDSFETDTLIVGAGVIGLAIARALAGHVEELLVVESENMIGSGISSRNSEVIHAGIYYPEGSLKARLCVEGRGLLYEYCESHNIPFRRCGKLIVASDLSQSQTLDRILNQGRANGVTDLCWLDEAELRLREPSLCAVAGVHSPSTGIIDSHQLMLQLQGDAERQGALFAFNSPVVGGRVHESGFEVFVGGTSPCKIRCRRLINAAGLGGVSLMRSLQGFPEHLIPDFYMARGNYFSLTVPSPFSHLIYPIPEAGGLGVHLTLDLSGQARFGPDVEWIDQIDYQTNADRMAHFYHEIRRYWLLLPEGSLQPSYCGIRPKLSGPGEANADFVLQDETQHGISGLINLLGIESPGLTASLAIARQVKSLLIR
ncbi:MAG: NAD(P)/FAD-dependent oxidoreductase [Hahellaceae bacterium]|nr:NAD(P)/FAD-dependent oxidoreductase [Hahellaceae bacterium]